MRRWMCVLVVLLAWVPLRALAVDCANGTRVVTYLLTMSSIKIAADAPMGSTVWSKSGLSFDLWCSAGMFAGGDGVNLWRHTLTMPADGLELVLTYKGDAGSGAAKIYTGTYVDNNSSKNIKGTFDLALRKVGVTPTQGNVSTSQMTLFNIDGNSNNGQAPYGIDGLNNISFVSYTCEINAGSRTINVPLGEVLTKTFTGIGSTSPDKHFNIGLTCTQPAGTYTVALTFNATADASKASGVLALTGGASAASGVGIQLLKDSTPVEFGHELPIGTAESGVLSIPMTARYYQTAADIKPGQANGIATFVVSYK